MSLVFVSRLITTDAYLVLANDHITKGSTLLE
jgi:hypothetical protein